MFTRNIKTLVQVGKSGVRWSSAAPAGAPPSITDAYKEVQDLRALWEKHKGWGNTPEREAFLNALKSVTIQNEDNKNRIVSQINDEIFSAQNIGDRNGADKLISFRQTVESDYAKLKAEYEREKAKIEKQKREKTIDISGKNTRTEQANAFVVSMESAKLDVTKFTKQTIASGEATTETLDIDLSDVSLPGLANHLLKGVPYTPDGAYGWREQDMVKKFVEYYNSLSSKDAINKLLASVVAGNLTGMRADTMSQKVEIESDNLRQSVLNIVKYEGKDPARQNVANVVTAVIGNIPADKLPGALVRALKLGGYEGNVDNTNVATVLNDQTVQLQLIAGLMRSARHMGGAAGLTAEKIMTPGDSYRKLLESLENKDFEIGFRSRLDSVLDTEIQALEGKVDKNVAENTKLTALKAYKESLNTDTVFNAHFQGFTAFVTNQGSGVSASWSGRIDTFLADTVNLGLGIDSVSKKPMVGLMFGKALSTNTQIMYGYAGAPIAGVAHRFDAGYDVSIMGNKLGGAISVSKDMQPARRIEEVTAKVSTDKAILDLIEGWAKDTSKKVNDVKFQGPIPKAFEGTGDDKSQITQQRYDAINVEISSAARTYLSMSNFDNETNPYVRASLIQEALRRAVQDRVDAHNFDTNSGGWSLAKIGAVLGMFGGAKFLLPFVSFERTNIVARMKTAETKVTTVSAPKRDALDANGLNALVGQPKWSSDGKSYTVPLVKNGAMNDQNTTFADGMEGVSITNNAIVGLSGYDVKIVKNGEKYVVSYDNNKPIQPPKAGEAKGIEVSKISLEQAIRTELSNPEVRKQLSNLWLKDQKGNITPRSIKVNEFATALQEYQAKKEDSAISRAGIAFLEATKGLGALTKLRTAINNDQTSLVAALYDIRGAMMMDLTEARKIQPGKQEITVDEKPELTKKRFDTLVNTALSGTTLLSGKGLDESDFNGVLKSGSGPITLSEPKEGLIGAIASMKSTPQYMAIMPNGTVRVAKRGNDEFINNLQNPSQGKKAGIFDLVLPQGGRGAQEMITKINALAGDGINLNHDQVKTLFTTGEVKVGEKTIKMTDQKFYTLAYGDCTNPGVALKPGKISVTEPGKPTITGESITLTKAEYSVGRTDLSLDATAQSLTGAVGVIRPGQTTETTRAPDTYETRIETRDVKIEGPFTTPTGTVYDVTVGGNTVRLDFQSIARTYGPQARAIIDAVQQGRPLPTLTTTESVTVTIPGATTTSTIDLPISPAIMRSILTSAHMTRMMGINIDDALMPEIEERYRNQFAQFNN